MNNKYILAQAWDQDEPDSITTTPIGAEETTTTTGVASDSNAAAPPVTRSKPGWTQFMPLVLIFVIMYLFLFRGPRKKRNEHKKMVQTLQKNDKIRTIGGIIGTVVEVRDDEIILKVDESNNTKIRIAPSAIGGNLSKDKT